MKEQTYLRDMLPELPARPLDRLLISKLLDHLLYPHHQFLKGTLHHRNQVELALHTSVQCAVKSDLEQFDSISPTKNNGQLEIPQFCEIKKQRVGSLIVETPIQHDYEAGVEVRSLLPTERLEEIDGRLAVTMSRKKREDVT